MMPTAKETFLALGNFILIIMGILVVFVILVLLDSTGNPILQFPARILAAFFTIIEFFGRILENFPDSL